MEKETTYLHQAKFECLKNIHKQTSDLYLVHCGYHQCSPNYSYNHKIPNEYHLHFVMNGKGTLFVNGKKYIANKNDIFIIPKGTEFSYKADQIDPWEYGWVTFDGVKAEDYLAHVNLSKSNPIIMSEIPTKNYMPIITKILGTSELTYANELKRVGFLFEILSLLISSQSAGRYERNEYDYSNETYIEYALEFIANNYKHIKINDIANYIGINRCYFTSIFKKQLNISPQEYLIEYKLKVAHDLLISSNESIQEISEKVGYNDCFSFSKAFKQQYGKSPKLYRDDYAQDEEN